MRCRGNSNRYEKLARASAAMIKEEFAATEEKWEKISVPDRQEVRSIKDCSICLDAEIAQLVATQPKCWLLKESYNPEFSKYRAKVEEASLSNRRALRILEVFSTVKAKLGAIQNDIESLRDLKKKNREFIKGWLESYVLTVFGLLGMLKISFEKLSNEKLEGQEEMMIKFEKNSLILEPLRKHTHKWKPIETHKVIFKPEYIPPEWSSKKARKAEVKEYVTRRKCEKCLKEEKVDYSSDLHF